MPDFSLLFDFFEGFGVASLVFLLEVFQMCSAIRNHFDKSAPRMVVFLVFLEVGRKFAD